MSDALNFLVLAGLLQEPEVVAHGVGPGLDQEVQCVAHVETA
jgi:hypothetical protein